MAASVAARLADRLQVDARAIGPVTRRHRDDLDAAVDALEDCLRPVSVGRSRNRDNGCPGFLGYSPPRQDVAGKLLVDDQDPVAWFQLRFHRAGRCAYAVTCGRHHGVTIRVAAKHARAQAAHGFCIVEETRGATLPRIAPCADAGQLPLA
jgi:hypothetical protein